MDINRELVNSLAVNIDICDSGSWNFGNEYIIKSINGLSNVTVNALTLPDFGLTAIDNGRVSHIGDGFYIDPSDNKMIMDRVGYYSVSGDSINYDGYELNAVTGTSVGNYMSLVNGYFQGFFKLDGYDYELLPSRYNDGITIETLIEILPQSAGIFYLMGLRAEDKYSQAYFGETITVSGTTILYNAKETGYTYTLSGITTSKLHYLAGYDKLDATYTSFRQPEEYAVVVDIDTMQIDNIKNNIIAFEITSDKRIGIRYVNAQGNVMYVVSPNIISRIGWSLIDIVFTPDSIIQNYDPNKAQCYAQRKGTLSIYINGGLFWGISDFDEFYFRGLKNDDEKQLGVPYNISWGGGSFGLKHSLHYTDFDKTSLTLDPSKYDQLIEHNFNSSYIGNIQKLRIYNKALANNEVRQNAIILALSNSAYDLSVINGGRLIRRLNQPVTFTQINAGSDIRKSIKYRNIDGTYKNLSDMLDIKVVIKSRNNPSVELAKYKKASEAGWRPLIYVNDFIYDFIVPNEITSPHSNEILFAEIKFQWTDISDIDDGIFDRIFVINITNIELNDNSVKNY
jgi:hypothetical protein